MGKLYSQANWLIRAQNNEHPPVHVHVIHPDGKAIVTLDGVATNAGVPARVLKAAQAWVAANAETICAEWARINNPARKEP